MTKERTLKEKIQYTIMEEVDVYINMVQTPTYEEYPDVRKFIVETVIPRFNILRKIVSEYKD